MQSGKDSYNCYNHCDPWKRFSDHSNQMETTLMTSAIVVVTVIERVIGEGASVIHHNC